MEHVIGFGLALALGFAATAIGFDRERSFYPVVLIVIASYYILFAAMAGAVNALTAEAVPFALFGFLAVLGFKRSSWFARGAVERKR